MSRIFIHREIESNQNLGVEDKRNAIAQFLTDLRNVKHDILSRRIEMGQDIRTQNPYFLGFVFYVRHNILPPPRAYTAGENLEKPIAYDLAANPCNYFKGMLFMLCELEQFAMADDPQGQIKLYNLFPMVTTTSPGHFRMDTTTLNNLLFKDKKYRGRKMKHLKRFRNRIWGKYFKLEKPIFKNKEKHGPNGGNMLSSFDYQVVTDGVSCSILFKKIDMGRGEEDASTTCYTSKSTPRKRPGTHQQDAGADQALPSLYIDEQTPAVQFELRTSGKTVVAIDPNMADLLFCTNNDGLSGAWGAPIRERPNTRDPITNERTPFRARTNATETDNRRWRYTQNSRRKDLYLKRHRRTQRKIKRGTVVEERTVQEWENDLRVFNKKTMIFDAFKEFVRAKNRYNAR